MGNGRDTVGSWWLRWYVHRADPSRAIRDIGAQWREARQLRVRDLDDAAVWAAMAEHHAAGIEHFEQRFAGADTAVIVVPAWMTPEGPVIIDGAHRAAALYRLAPATLDADVVEIAPPDGHLDTLPGLRT